MSRVSTVPLHGLHGGLRNRSSLHRSTSDGRTTAHFGELRQPLVAFITGSEIVVGAVAWITCPKIVAALAARPVALVVQKENWWKKADTRGRALAARYASLRGGICASALPAPLSSLTDSLPPIACVGYSKAGSFPLMHHKFIVRCKQEDTPAGPVLVPLAVWTGSFNFSGNANDSLENAVEIHDPAVAAAYLREFALVASLSEGLNWRMSKPSPAKLRGKAVVAKEFVIPLAAPVTQSRASTGRASARTRKRPAKKTASKRAAPKRAAPKRAASKRPPAKKAAPKRIAPKVVAGRPTAKPVKKTIAAPKKAQAKPTRKAA